MSASHRLRGYAMVGGSAVMFGATGVWVGITDLPASTVLCMRMALAAVLVALLGGATRWLRQSRRPGVWPRLLALGLLDAVQLYTFMLALRHLDVALAVFLSYMSPIYIALVAPRLLRQRTEPVVIAALVLAVCGIIVMLAPGLMDPALRVSALGVAIGLASGLLLAVFFLIAKTLSADVDGSTMLISNGVIVAVVMLPLGLVQWAGADFAFALTDLWAVLGLAVFCTALGGTIFLHGMRYIPVQHTSIVGLLEPASAPLFAFLFLSERPSLWTLVGGALILVGAVLVVLLGSADEGLAGSPEEAVGEAEAIGTSRAEIIDRPFRRAGASRARGAVDRDDARCHGCAHIPQTRHHAQYVQAGDGPATSHSAGGEEDDREGTDRRRAWADGQKGVGGCSRRP